MNELVLLKDEQVVYSSLDVAERFGKKHSDLIRKIENGISNFENAKLHFQKSYYKTDGNNRE